VLNRRIIFIIFCIHLVFPLLNHSCLSYICWTVFRLKKIFAHGMNVVFVCITDDGAGHCMECILKNYVYKCVICKLLSGSSFVFVWLHRVVRIGNENIWT
jgi:hypothetical protein